MQSIGRTWFAVLILIAIAVAPRLVHLSADPPSDFISDDVGFHVDEGYKTLSPRNLVLFGATHWSTVDTYPGWMQASPITQWAYYASFSILGVDRTSVRLVTIVVFAAFLLMAAAFFTARYGGGVALFGVFLLAANQALFHFSRVATFELPLILLVYGGIFIAAHWTRSSVYLSLLALVVIAAVATLGVKSSALVYLVPAIAVLIIAVIPRGARARVTAVPAVVIAAGVLFIAAMVVFKSGAWIGRVGLLRPGPLLARGMYELSPLAFSAASLALIDISLRNGVATFRDNKYLSMVAAVALVSPVIWTFLRPYPRYYVVVLPALLLVTIEWLQLRRAGALTAPYRFSKPRIAFLGLVSIPLAASLVDFACDSLVPLLTHAGHGIARNVHIRVVLYALLIAGLWALMWHVSRRSDRSRVVPLILVAAIGLQLAFSVKSIAAALLRPSYVATDVGRQLESIVAEGESLAGDWAPFLAIDTRIRVLYTAVDFNDSGEIGVVRPAYFVFSHTPSGRRIRTLIKRSGIQMNGPTRLGSLFGAPLELWKLEYPDQGSR